MITPTMELYLIGLTILCMMTGTVIIWMRYLQMRMESKNRRIIVIKEGDI